MIVYPAIDIKGGQCVRLRQGDMADPTHYNSSPQAQAELFAHAGAEWLHCVDLDGAVAGKQVNSTAIESLLTVGLKVQLGGGIRSRADIDAWLGRGVARVVLGTLALTEPEVLVAAAKHYPGQIMVAADASDGKIMAEGWQKDSTLSVLDLVGRFEDCGVAGLIFTDIGRDGMLGGVNLSATKELAQATSMPVIASGGVADIAEIKQLAANGIAGVIIGRALYEGRIDLAAALVAASHASSKAC